ncbi:MAG: copper resistance system multicopper oxidase, partial [Thermohalobaculum sp.]|nr:copper resistance system multicopper oxidase [Thermohalobaculum sp.]
MTMIARLRAGALAAVIGAALATPQARAGTYDLSVDRVTIDTGDFTRTGIGYNGASPGPVLRFKEGEDVTINVTNTLDEWTSVHWHGLILPFRQDGVPGVSFDGIAPGETFTYRFPIVQAGTYWFHSHSGFQEADGAYGAIVIEPADREPFRYDRDHVVQLTDAHPHSGSRIMRNLKTMPDYYNRQQRTLIDFLGDAADKGLGAALSDRADWGNMRMMPTDIEDVQGFTPLINGKGPEGNWTALFQPGERVRLRFINSSAMAYFDIRIPGLKMTVVQADGQNVQPVTVDELRIAVAETYDVIVRPTEDRAYSILAESMGRTAMARGTLAPREGMAAEVPALREPPRLTMADMGMAHAGMDHGAMGGGHMMPDGSMMTGAAHGTGGDAA